MPQGQRRGSVTASLFFNCCLYLLVLNLMFLQIQSKDRTNCFCCMMFHDRWSIFGRKKYSKTCLKRPPHGARKSGRCRQVVSKARFPRNRPIFRSSVEQLRTLWYARVWSTQLQFTSIWCKRWPHAIVFSQTCAVVAVLTVNMGQSNAFPCCWSLKTGKIRSLVQKMPVAGRVRQVVA